MVPVGNGDKINVHQPFAASGNILAAGEYHHVGFAAGLLLIFHVFEDFGQPHLSLRMALLKLAQNGKQPLARENTVHNQVQTGSCAVAQGRRAGFNV
jgi:hypothetical protein